MKIFQQSKYLAVLTVFFFTCSVSSLLAKPKDKNRWNSKYETEVYLFGEKPIPFLADNVHLLPKGKVLDIAMGEGRNGVYLATQGFEVLGLDISEKGLEKAHNLAKKNKVTIETKVVDLESFTLEPNSYDVILCTYYMQKDLFKQFQSALKPGGMIVVETYNVDYLKYAQFSRKWALDTNEMLDIFKGLRVIRYQDYDDGKEAYSSIIAQKPE
ncbi:MAG: class I SAM-dependent methyltransferase [Nitrospinaceae bacterium]